MSSLLSTLQQLESRFTWGLSSDLVDLENLSTRLQEHIDLQLGRPGATARSHGFLAYVRYLQGRPEEAGPLLLRAERETRASFGEESERRLIVTLGDLAWLKYHTGDYTQAQDYRDRVHQILEKHPTGSRDVLHPEVSGEKAWTLLKFTRSYYGRATQCFRDALQLQPDDAEWNAGYAIALYRTEPAFPTPAPAPAPAPAPGPGARPEESPATRQLRRALRISPEDGVLMAMLALKLDQNPREAEDLVATALRVSPENPHVTRYVAKYLRNQGEVQRSVHLLQQALERSPLSAFLHHQLALCYKKQKINEHNRKPVNRQRLRQLRCLCVQHLQEAVRLKPSFLIAMADLALLHGEARDFSRAEELFQQASKFLPEAESSSCVVFHQRYGDFHLYHTKQEQKAVEPYTQALQLARATGEAKYSAKRLKQIAERRLSEDGSDARALGLLALVSRAQGDRRRAAELYEAALDRDEDNDHFLSALCELRLELQGGEDTPPT